MIELPYGRVPYPLDLGRAAAVVEAVPLPATRNLPVTIEEALAAPTGSPVRAGARVAIVVSEATRNEPRRRSLEAVARHLPATGRPIALATETHGWSPREPFALPRGLARAAPLIAHRDMHQVDLRDVSRRNPGRLARCAVETDVVITPGCGRPPNVAGFGDGGMARSLGRGEACVLRKNRARKDDPCSRARVIDDSLPRRRPARSRHRVPRRAWRRRRALRVAPCPGNRCPGLFSYVRSQGGRRGPASVTSITQRSYQVARLEPSQTTSEVSLRFAILPRTAPRASITMETGLAPLDVTQSAAPSDAASLADEFLAPSSGRSPAEPLAHCCTRLIQLGGLPRQPLLEARS